MNKIMLVILWGLFPFFHINADSPRVVATLNDSWKFSRGDFQNALSNEFDDSKWERVTVPHTWNQADAVDEVPGYYRGVGWYRRALTLPDEYKNKQVYLSFDGVNQEAELFVNGKSAGKHVGGYTRFCFDISQFLNYGQPNLLAVKVNNQYNENIPPLTADFTFFGGIYRDINLIITEKQHITTTHFASSGVYVSTPSVSEKEALVNIKTMVSNDQAIGCKLRIETMLLSNNGEQVTRNTKLVKISPNSTLTVEQSSMIITQPQLWSPDSPTLYKVVTRIYEEKTNKLLDEAIQPLGLRWYEFNADKGFFLNGKPLKLIGTNRHQCYLNMGNALPDELHERDVKLLKDMGANFLRVSHYPQDHVLMEMCDKLGIICSVEIPIVNTIAENDAFTGNCLNMAREMVLQDFNRPSVVIWAYMNEVLLRPPFKEGSARYSQYIKSLSQLALKIENQLRTDDSVRYTMIPCHGNLEIYKSAGLLDIPKIVGFNLYQGWYTGSFDEFDSFLNTAKQKVIGKPFIVTEYGADVDPRLHSFDPERFDYTQEYANLYHEHYIKSIMERPYVAGGAIWNLNDFYSEQRANAVPHVNSKGIVGLARDEKDTYLQYQAMLQKTPIVCISGKNWKIRGGNADFNGVCLQPVKVYSNQKIIELILNGKSLAKQTVINSIAQFTVPFTNGNNTLDAVANTEDGIIRDQLRIDFKSVPFNLKDSKQQFSEINVMLGSKRYFEDKTGSMIWIPEQKYTIGSWGYIGGTVYTKKLSSGSQPASDLDIYGTTNDPVFQTMRVGLESFKIDVPVGKYTVCLYWAELQSDKKRKELAYNLGNDALKDESVKRVFDVNINNTITLKALDLTEEYGAQTAVIKKYEVNVTDNKGITVNFKKVVGEPVLNAIRIYKNY